jgi:hypothetical protein
MGFVANRAMKSAGGENPNTLGPKAQQPSTWRGSSELISLRHLGCEARKIPAEGDICFLTSSFIEPSVYKDLSGLGNIVESATAPLSLLMVD